MPRSHGLHRYINNQNYRYDPSFLHGSHANPFESRSSSKSALLPASLPILILHHSFHYQSLHLPLSLSPIRKPIMKLKDLLEWITFVPIIFCCICPLNLLTGNWRDPSQIHRCGTARHNDEERRKARKQALAENKKWASRLPRPLPARRKRRLTLPLLEESSLRCPLILGMKKKQRTDSQSQSPFFSRFPIELRQMIYREFVLDGSSKPHFRMLRKKSQPRLGCLRHRSHDPDMIFDPSWWGAVGSHGVRCACCTREETDTGMLFPLLTCRRFYSEMVHVLYQSPVFEFKDPATLLLFRSTVLPSRIFSVRSVHLTWQAPHWPQFVGPLIPREQRREHNQWLRFCNVMREMKGLKRLVVVLENVPMMANFYLPPLRRIQHVDDFVVGVDEVRGCDDVDAPFRIIEAPVVSSPV